MTTRHVSDDARHAAMVGMVAGAYGAHLIVSVVLPSGLVDKKSCIEAMAFQAILFPFS